MKTEMDVLVGLLAVKELAIRNLRDRVAILEQHIKQLDTENRELYALIQQAQEAQEEQTERTRIGFKKGDGDEKA